MGRSSLRHNREIQGIDAAGETPEMYGETYNNLRPGDQNPNGPAAVEFHGEIPDSLLSVGEEVNANYGAYFSGGDLPITYSIAPALPASLSFDTATGRLTGSADATAASTAYQITATDQSTDTAQSNSFNIEVV